MRLTLTFILGVAVSAADNCGSICETTDGCHESFCKDWMTPSVCQGLAEKPDGSICFLSSPDCSGASVACSADVTTSAPATTSLRPTSRPPVRSTTSTARPVTTAPIAKDNCGALCDSAEGCHDSYCTDWTTPAVCHGLAQQGDGSICYVAAGGCSGSAVACSSGPPGPSTTESLPVSTTVTTRPSTTTVTTRPSTTTVTTGPSTTTVTTRPSTTTVTSRPSSTTVTTQRPATTTPGGGGKPNCPNSMTSEEDVFWWTEWPSMDSDKASWTLYYQRLFRLLTENCAYMRVNKLILRVLHPQFPPGKPSSEKLWYPNEDVTQSVMFTELLSKLDQTSVRAVEMHPYLFDSEAQAAWTDMSPNGSGVMSGVYGFVDEWNKHLPGTKFTGVTVDYEELHQVEDEYALLWDAGAEAEFKDGHMDMDFGIAVGYDQLGRFGEWQWTDNFYMEMYDFSKPFAYVDSSDESRFLLHKNDPASMVDYVVNEVMGETITAAYAQHASKAHLMWSMQSIGSDAECHYPLNDGNCGINHEFGHWDANPFNAFLREVKAELGTGQAQGIYNYEYLPYEMMPTDMRHCYSFGC